MPRPKYDLKKWHTRRDVQLPRVTYAEAATIMAALRIFEALHYQDGKADRERDRSTDTNGQRNLGPEVLANLGHLDQIMEHFEDVKPATLSAIDKLCLRINTMPIVKKQHKNRTPRSWKAEYLALARHHNQHCTCRELYR